MQSLQLVLSPVRTRCRKGAMRKSVFALSLSLLAVGVYAVFLQLEVGRLKGMLAASEGRGTGAALTDEIAKIEEGEAPERQVERGSDASPQVVQAPPTARENAEEDRREEWRERRRARMEQMASLFEDPQMRADMVERQMNRIDERYAAFFKTLNLSREDLDTLRVLMAERGVLNWEGRMRRAGADTDEERKALEAERESQRDLVANEIQALLGKENADALKVYNDSLPYRNEVEALASSLSFTESPLSAEQSEALVSSIQSASLKFEYTKDLSQMRGPSMAEVSQDDIQTYFSERAERDALVLEAASESLDDAQLAALAERQMAERDRDRRQMEFMQQNPPPDGRWGRGPRP